MVVYLEPMKSVGVLMALQLMTMEHVTRSIILVHQASSSAAMTSVSLKSGSVTMMMTVGTALMR